MCKLFFLLDYIVYKVKLVDKRYEINLMKGKHYNIIPYPLSHTKIVYIFNHFPTTYYPTYLT